MDKFQAGIPSAVKHLSGEAITDFAEAILTTDTHIKIVEKEGQINGRPFSIIGIAKGSGMIRPDMATMLAYICTDVNISQQDLMQCLSIANNHSFHRITIDGDTSTNDTLFALASDSGDVEITSSASRNKFQTMLNDVCLSLAKLIVKDGEGATKLIQIIVKGAQSDSDAFKACETIAHSNLVKTAIYGEDPNWGRITAAAGRSGAQVDPNKMDLFFNDQALVAKGRWLGKEAEIKAARIMKNDDILITLDLNIGTASDTFFFCDFSENYVKINAEYRT